MDYTCVTFNINPVEPYRDLLIGELGLLEFESFEETDQGVRAFIPKDQFTERSIQQLSALEIEEVSISYVTETIPAQNWNATWEADFVPIEVNGDCRIRAPFHPDEGVKFELVIQPQMSFGTGHHETTWLVMRQMLKMDMKGRDVLDMGSGTGVLAILASKMGAASVVAIDVDEWAYQNAKENAALNSAVHIAVEKGSVQQIGQRQFHVILANINKNVLLQDIPTYADHLKQQGTLILSGFFEKDVTDLIKRAKECGMILRDKAFKNDWAVLELQKN